MDDQPLTSVTNGSRGEFALGTALVSPALRSVTGLGGRSVLEPRMMQVLVVLAERPGRLVTRTELVERCWAGAAVGEDSINRAISGIRRAARTAGHDAFRIETVAGSGYALVVGDGVAERAPGLADDAADQAVQAGWRAWRLGLPAINLPDLDALRAAALASPGRADVWGMLALMLRHAVEYADTGDCAGLVSECEDAARYALALDRDQPEAVAALVGIWPIYGDWQRRRAALVEALDKAPGHPPTQHDLLILEMSTGRPSVAIGYLEDLYARDGLAAIYQYKLVYQYWSLGRMAEAETIADRAIQLWPRHPAIWFCRFFHLAFTGRAAQAAQHLRDEANRPPVSPVALVHLEATVASLLEPSSDALRASAVEASLAAAERGPAQCVHALMALSGLGEVNAAFELAQGYFLGSGPVPVSIHRTPSDPTVNELHRRATQLLFIPTGASLRADPRFGALCDAMGLTAYWSACGIEPDFRSEQA